jgi:hypothetical protein
MMRAADNKSAAEKTSPPQDGNNVNSSRQNVLESKEKVELEVVELQN